MASSALEQSYQQEPVGDDHRGKGQSKSQGDQALIHHSGFLDKMKHAAQTATHAAGDLAHKGLEKGKELAHSQTGQKITHEVVSTGKELAQKNVRDAKGVVEAGKHGDIGGVITHAAPLVGEAALGPQGVLLKVAKDKAIHAAEGQVRSQVEQHSKEGQNKTGNNDKAQKSAHYLPGLTIDGADEGNKHRSKH